MFLETKAAMTWLADLVMAIHFGIAAFIAAGLGSMAAFAIGPCRAHGVCGRRGGCGW